MMKDQAIDYAEGLADIRNDEKRIRDIEYQIRSTDKVQSLPPLHLAEAALRDITEGEDEPTKFEQLRSILEGILDLNMKYHDADLEITGKIPIGEESATSKDSNCNGGVYGIYLGTGGLAEELKPFFRLPGIEPDGCLHVDDEFRAKIRWLAHEWLRGEWPTSSPGT